MVRNREWLPTLEAGELAPEYRFRTDSPTRNKGLLKARNIRLLSGGGWQRRWGTWRKVAFTGEVRLEKIGVGQAQASLFAFGHNRLDIYDSNWTLLQSITTGCPWTTSNIHKMTIAAEANRVTVASNNFFPKDIVRVGSTWSIADIQFAGGPGGSTKQPYYRFQDAGVTLTPSGLTGSINLACSQPLFVAADVGTTKRYQGIEIDITAFVDASNLTGTVVGSLYPTIDVPVDSSDGFLVGEIVKGQDTQVEGIVISLPSSTSVRVLLINGYETFAPATPFEKLVGPNVRRTITGASSSASPAATVDWDEQLISPNRGYPNCVAYHRGRRIFADFPQAPNLLCASSVGDVDDYDVGEASNSDAVIETVGRDDTLHIRFIGSMEQLLVFTDAGVFYVPETVGAPFSATNAEFDRIGPEAIGSAPPVIVSEGMIFAEARSGRLLVCIPTGNVRRSWDIADLSELSNHLMGTPRKIDVIPSVSNSDRELVVLKDNGEIVWFRYRRNGDLAGACLWTTQGSWSSIVSLDGKLMLAARRTLAGGVVHWGEQLGYDALLDGQASSSLYSWAHLANTNVTIAKSGQFLTSKTLDASGNASGIAATWGTVEAGFPSFLEVEYPSRIDGENGQFRVSSIIKAYFNCENTGSFLIDGHDTGAFSPTDADDALPSLITDVISEWGSGLGNNITMKITQQIPNPITVLATTFEVKA